MTARLYTHEDYPTIAEWWRKHGATNIHESLLKTIGVVAEEDGKIIAACWVYMALGVGLAFGPAWMTTDPALSPFKSAKVITFLVGAAEAAIPKEYNIVMAMPQNDSYKRLLERQGYQVAHPCTEMYKNLIR